MESSKFQHVMEQVKGKIAEGLIKPGDKLPSIREMSRQLGCSANTVIRAYAGLEQEHWIYSVPKSGYYAVVRKSGKEQGSPVEQIDFSSASPDPEVMPYGDFQHCLNRAIEQYRDQLFTYTDPQGFPSLREALSKHLASNQVFAPPERICVVSGSQQALHMLAGMPFPNGKSVILVEQPAYFGMLRSIELLGVTAIGIKRTVEGIDLEELERHFRSNSIKFFYTVPRYHNPLGCSYRREQKQKIAELAEKYDVYIVEDDYLGDLSLNPKDDPIYTEDASGHTVYLKSFSKVTLPGLRLAVAVLPPSLLETFRLFKAASDSSTAALSQGALEMYMGCGMFDRHLEQMRERYRVRMSTLRVACERQLSASSGIRASIPEGGIFARLLLPPELPARELAASLRARHIFVMPTDLCYLRGFPKENAIRLSIIRTHETRIEEGLRRIVEIVQEMLVSSENRVVDWREGFI
ncbi:PLP-dependent aminotransferase family protein [Paenibacillus rigui]|uniref:GntR family transcriptional regulator n=1 Tax=Paenibacillus rigui TaxID=554312 RepID=A0A229UHB0_9BACL|nr:PLP-dependent aminotransferase family protein [Paenibacillus rigui]OXM82788.1 GntR family transcriptional regulator [Paenibacillus rigui]